MKRIAKTLALVLFFAADVAAMFVLLRDPDPGYRLGAWLTFGRDHRFNERIAACATREHLDPTLVKSIVWRVSGFNPGKLGPNHERGLMQIGEGIGMDWSAHSDAPTFMQADLFGADTNLRAGCWYLRQLIDRWQTRDDPIPFALAEYAAGHGVVLTWAGPTGTAREMLTAINDAPTRSFVTDVLQRRAYYERDQAHRSGDFSELQKIPIAEAAPRP